MIQQLKSNQKVIKGNQNKIVKSQYLCGFQRLLKGFESLFPCFSSPESLNDDVGFWGFCFAKYEKKLEIISLVRYNMAGRIEGRPTK